MLIGGAGDDLLTFDLATGSGNSSGNNIILGDNGVVVRNDGSDDAYQVVSRNHGVGGIDTIRGGDGDNIIIGGARGDIIFGGAGNEIIIGDGGRVQRNSQGLPIKAQTEGFEGGADQIDGGTGSDVILGGAGGDVITANAGGKIILGDNGVVILNAIDGKNDIYTTDPEVRGIDVITGGADEVGNIILGGALGDLITGGRGNDVIVGDGGYVTRIDGVVVQVTTTGRLETCDVTGAFGGDDHITTNGGNNVILGGAGNDTITAPVGNNIILGDNGVVNLGGDYGNDVFTTSPETGGADIIIGGDGSNILIGGAAGDTITGGSGSDVILDGAAGDTIHGGDGNDIILGDNGRIDYLVEGNLATLDRIISTDPLNGGADTIYGGAGADIVFGGTGDDQIHGGAGNDRLLGDHGQWLREPAEVPHPAALPALQVTSIFIGSGLGAGNDLIYGDDGDDLILGQQGADTIYGGAGDDDIIGGHNVAGGRDAGDFLDGGAGNDVIAGDNALITRLPVNATNPRTRVLLGETIYGQTDGIDEGQPLTTAMPQPDPTGAAQRSIQLLDHSEDVQRDYQEFFGDDYIAGGAGDDLIFGQLGNDIIQGDGSIHLTVAASRAMDGTVTVSPSAEDWAGIGTDGDDYIGGGGGDDVVFGNLGQDDIIGGGSNLFGLANPSSRPDGADILFGSAGLDIARNQIGDETDRGHARDADVILGDNGNIFRLVGTGGVDSGGFLTFNYDTYTDHLPADEQLTIIPRAFDLLDYTFGGDPDDIGGSDLVFGGTGDDVIHGMAGNDVLYGNGHDDDIYGGTGQDKIFAGSGQDGVVADDGILLTSRNGLTEPLNNVTTASQQASISVPSGKIGAVIDIAGLLKKDVKLLAWGAGGDDVVYGGLGDDWIHGGAGNDAISGAEALPEFYYGASPLAGPPIVYDPATGKLAAYDADNPRVKIVGFLLNFEATDESGNKIEDGKDRLFGGLGHDWIVGGTGSDRLFGGPGDDVLNADDNHDNGTSPGLNNRPDDPEYADADFAFGGDGRDVLIANTGADRLFDWQGDYNTYVVPFSANGSPTVNRSSSPQVRQFLLDLGAASGADTSRSEPNGELGLSVGGNNGSARDPQSAGTVAGVNRDSDGRPEDDTGKILTPHGSTPGSESQTGATQSGGSDGGGGNGNGNGNGNSNGNGNGNGNGNSGNLMGAAASAQVSSEVAERLTDDLLNPIVTYAVAAWSALAFDAVGALKGIQAVIADLPDSILGQDRGNTIAIDATAAGVGWFIDATPWENSEFAIASGKMDSVAASESAAAGRYDLLTVVMHELGHLLGWEHAEEADHLMSDRLTAGTRRQFDTHAADPDPTAERPVWASLIFDSTVRSSNNTEPAPRPAADTQVPDNEARTLDDWPGMLDAMSRQVGALDAGDRLTSARYAQDVDDLLADDLTIDGELLDVLATGR